MIEEVYKLIKDKRRSDIEGYLEGYVWDYEVMLGWEEILDDFQFSYNVNEEIVIKSSGVLKEHVKSYGEMYHIIFKKLFELFYSYFFCSDIIKNDKEFIIRFLTYPEKDFYITGELRVYGSHYEEIWRG